MLGEIKAMVSGILGPDFEVCGVEAVEHGYAASVVSNGYLGVAYADKPDDLAVKVLDSWNRAVARDCALSRLQAKRYFVDKRTREMNGA